MSVKSTDTPIAGQAFEQFLDEQLRDPRFKAGFERKLAKVKSIAEVMQVIEAVREQAGLPKAELARRMDRKPSAVSRLLGGDAANPTLDTLVDLADALGLELDIRIKRQPARPRSAYSPLKVHAAV
ncbi:MAG: helix-turn-helix domain-containing protein [Solirubrobacteraceae bacterium]